MVRAEAAAVTPNPAPLLLFNMTRGIYVMSRASLGEAHSKIRFTKPFLIKKKKASSTFQSSQNLKLTLYKEIAAENG